MPGYIHSNNVLASVTRLQSCQQSSDFLLPRYQQDIELATLACKAYPGSTALFEAVRLGWLPNGVAVSILRERLTYAARYFQKLFRPDTSFSEEDLMSTLSLDENVPTTCLEMGRLAGCYLLESQIIPLLLGGRFVFQEGGSAEMVWEERLLHPSFAPFPLGTVVANDWDRGSDTMHYLLPHSSVGIANDKLRRWSEISQSGRYFSWFGTDIKDSLLSRPGWGATAMTIDMKRQERDIQGVSLVPAFSRSRIAGAWPYRRGDSLTPTRDLFRWILRDHGFPGKMALEPRVSQLFILPGGAWHVWGRNDGFEGLESEVQEFDWMTIAARVVTMSRALYHGEIPWWGTILKQSRSDENTFITLQDIQGDLVSLQFHLTNEGGIPLSWRYECEKSRRQETFRMDAIRLTGLSSPRWSETERFLEEVTQEAASRMTHLS